MSKGPMQKLKLLYLRKIMLEKTDEAHPLTLEEIKSELAKYDISAERKSLYDDLRALETFGLDICKKRTKTVKYYVGSRDFEIPELKLLVDAIQSSKFITGKKSLALIKKLEGLVSENDGRLIHREVYVTNRVKSLNERIYYNTDKIQSAIHIRKKIRFYYYSWKVNFDGNEKIIKEKRRGGKLYTMTPLSLCWDDENYYLVAFDAEAQSIKHFRVDKMENITATKQDRDQNEIVINFDPVKYAKSVFSMFGGDKTTVCLSVDNSLIGVIVDRFGKNIFISKESGTSFIVNLDVALSPQFYAWLFGFGDKVKILSPKRAADEFKDKINTVLKLYM